MTITLDHLVALRLLEGTDVFFVQIGAFDGKSGDQIHKYVVRYGWRGIVVEPQTRPFAELQATYAGQPHLELRNVAIAERRETRTLYTVDRDATGLPEWAAQVASFDPEHLWRHGIRAIASEDVSCIPLTELLQGVERVDLLQIDVEGFDAEIIRMFDFERYRPRIVRFENAHLTRGEHERAIQRLITYDYRVAVADNDTLGWSARR